MGHMLPFPADGYDTGWALRDGTESVALRWDNEAWTVTGRMSSENVEYVVRLSPMWRVRQFLLFRDLDEPDLWLGTDGHGRWGEVNGAHRTDLDGSTDIAVRCGIFTRALPIRRLPLEAGHAAEMTVLDVDVETLGVVAVQTKYERVDVRRWRVRYGSEVDEFDVDEFGLPLDVGTGYRRLR